MKYAYFGFGMLLFGSIGLVLIVMMQSVTINNDSEYYNLKEAMQAAMLESVDYVCDRVDGKTVTPNKNNKCGYLLKISEQKFVENFTRRFAATVAGDATSYSLEFYDIVESPPKASVAIKAKTNNYGIVSNNQQLTITNSLSSILELEKDISGDYSYYDYGNIVIDDKKSNIDFSVVNGDKIDLNDNEIRFNSNCSNNNFKDYCKNLDESSDDEEFEGDDVDEDDDEDEE